MNTKNFLIGFLRLLSKRYEMFRIRLGMTGFEIDGTEGLSRGQAVRKYKSYDQYVRH